MYLRNADSVGCNFCLVRQHGSATTICSKTFIAYALQKSIFNCSSVYYNWEVSVSLIRYTFNQMLNSKPLASFILLCVPLPHSRKLQRISPSLYRRKAGELQKESTVYRGDKLAVKPPAYEHNITA
jgi:hypothetical protein